MGAKFANVTVKVTSTLDRGDSASAICEVSIDQLGELGVVAIALYEEGGRPLELLVSVSDARVIADALISMADIADRAND